MLFFLDAKMEPFSLVFISTCRGKIRCGFRNTIKIDLFRCCNKLKKNLLYLFRNVVFIQKNDTRLYMTSGVKQGEGALGTPFVLIQHRLRRVHHTQSHVGLNKTNYQEVKTTCRMGFPLGNVNTFLRDKKSTTQIGICNCLHGVI